MFGGVDRVEVILNGLTFVPSVTNIILFGTLVTSYQPFHFFLFSRYKRSLAPGRMRYFVADGSLLRSAAFVLFSVTILSLSTCSSCNYSTFELCCL